MNNTPKPETSTYLLRNIPKPLWDKAKHKAIDDGDSLRDLVLKAVKEYVK